MTVTLKMDDWIAYCASGSAFLDLTTGRIVTFCPDPAGGIAEVDEDGRCGMCGEKHMPTLEEVEAAPDRYAEIPSCEKTADEGGMMMRDYIATIPPLTENADLRNRLTRAIEGRGAFRYFRDVVNDAGRGEEWEAFRTQRQTEHLREWCKQHDVILEE
jgi:hypothetical protein